MPDQAAVKPTEKKRQSKAGFKRVTVSLPEEAYKKLVSVANGQMREPNNMLSYILKDRLEAMLGDYAE